MKKISRWCHQHHRQAQVMRVLQGQYGLSVKQIARRLKVTEGSVRRYLPPLLDNDLVVVNFKAHGKGKKPINYYAIKNYG